MEINIPVNRIQLMCKMLSPRNLVLVCGRATGKSWIHGQRLDEAIRWMPRCTIGMPVKTFGTGYTGTFQTMLSALDKFGYVKDGNYVVNRRPPESWEDSYGKIEKYENCISIANGCKMAMFSQTESGNMRGVSVDKLMADEVLVLSEEKLMKEAFPTNRGNLEHFGKGAHHACHLHHGFDMTTSMPYNREGRWIFKFAQYYREKYGIEIMQVWNRIVHLQQQLLDTDSPKQFAECWNDIEDIRRQMPPRVSDDGTLFYVANAFDNLANIGLKYIKDQRDVLTNLEFLIEILNLYLERVEDCFYNLDEQRHVYYTGYDIKAMEEAGLTANADLGFRGKMESAKYDRDYDPDRPLEIAPDWGSQISLFVVCQTFRVELPVVSAVPGYIPETSFSGDYLYQINEFFDKPDGSGTIIDNICNRFCNYYANHRHRVIHYYRDRYGDHRNPNVVNSKSFNEQAMEIFRKRGWTVVAKVHRLGEPPMSDKHLLWQEILSERPSCPVRFRINGNRCHYTVISMNNARMVYGGNVFKKDKRSEKPSSGVLPEEATHFSDAIDKLVWTKYGDSVAKKRRMFVRTSLG
ncbi:MAG: hypothetical protein K5885_02345 [Bacteroidales bacterium]|nr:hypothetical protein [Bacteroidales bacterium]